MTQEAIFLVGIIIFAITVYGAVMAGGIALTRVMDDEGDRRKAEAEDGHQASVSSPAGP